MGDLNELVAVEVERKLSDPAYLQRAVLALTEKIMAKDRQLEVLAEAKGFYDRVTESDDWMEMAAAVKVLAFKGYGRNKTFILLRKNQVLRSDNEPYQEYIDRGYFKQVEEAEAEEKPEDLPSLEVSITSDAGSQVYEGDTITLTAHVPEWTEGYGCDSIWRRSNGSGWVVVATDSRTHAFTVDQENFHWTWEFVYTVHVPAAAAHVDTEPV